MGGIMSDQELLKRIMSSQDVMTGKPVIQGTRLSVEYILNLLAHGASTMEILEEYDGLVEADISACLLFASCSLESSCFKMFCRIPTNSINCHNSILQTFSKFLMPHWNPPNQSMFSKIGFVYQSLRHNYSPDFENTQLVTVSEHQFY